jgi:hypothetical protein
MKRYLFSILQPDGPPPPPDFLAPVMRDPMPVHLYHLGLRGPA